jgi:hypothetical protein
MIDQKSQSFIDRCGVGVDDERTFGPFGALEQVLDSFFFWEIVKVKHKIS